MGGQDGDTFPGGRQWLSYNTDSLLVRKPHTEAVNAPLKQIHNKWPEKKCVVLAWEVFSVSLCTAPCDSQV
jgi:hypothetical protein